MRDNSQETELRDDSQGTELRDNNKRKLVHGKEKSRAGKLSNRKPSEEDQGQ